MPAGCCSISTRCWRMCSCRASDPITTSRACGRRPRNEEGERLPPRPRRTSDQLRVAVEDLAQVGGRLDAVFLHHVEQAEDVPHAGECHALLARQVLDHLDLADVAL